MEWSAEANFDTDPPIHTCTMTAPSVKVIQSRAGESSQMRMRWDFFPDIAVDAPVLLQAKLGRDHFEVAKLPWRLARPSADGIILAYDVVLLVARRNGSAQWLPFEYLTDDLFDLPSFELTYRTEDDSGEPRIRKQRFDLRGFKQAAKWCGRQLLRDRLGEKRVSELTE